LLLLVGCTVAAVVAIIVFADPGDVVAPPGAGGTGANGADADRSNGISGTGTSAASDQGPILAGTPHVRITVTSKEQFVAPIHTLPLAISVDGRLLPTEILAGVGAGFDTGIDRRGLALIAIDFDGGRLLRQIVVGPSIESVARVGARVVLRGRVLDVAQNPVAGATVWLGEITADGSEREYAVDDQGAFEANVPAGEAVPFVVRAPGFASIWRAMAVTPTSQPLSEVLQPAASLSVQLAARADALESVRVFVVPQAPVSTGVSQWPFFRQCLSGGYPVNDNGQAVIDDLPQHGTLGVIVRHPLAVARRAITAKLEVKPVRVTVPVVFATGRQLGVVADTDGNPIVSASVWIRSPSQRLQGVPSLRLLPPHIDVLGVCFATTGLSGEFHVGLLGEEPAVMSVRARGFAGRDVSPQTFMNSEVVLPALMPGEASLRILPPMIDEDWRVSINLGDGITENCSADEPFVVALPHAGRFDVEVIVEVDDKPRGMRDVKNLMVTGLIDLVTKAPN
jgi:hypothetical protein